MQKIKYINFSSAIFHGFYDSDLYNGDSLYWLNENLEEEDKGYYDFVGDSYKNFEEETARQCASALYSNLKTEDLIQGIEYKGLSSPKYYNFETDKLILDIDCNVQGLIDYCKQNREDFNQYLQDNWKSRDGFMSFVPDNVPAFFADLETDFDKLIQVIIEYYLLKNLNMDSYEEECREIANDNLYEYTTFVKGEDNE